MISDNSLGHFAFTYKCNLVDEPAVAPNENDNYAVDVRGSEVSVTPSKFGDLQGK